MTEGAPGSSLLPTPEAPGRLPWAVAVLEGRNLLLGLAGIALVAGDAFRWWALGLGLVFVGRLIRLRLTLWWVTDESFVIQRGLLFRSRRVISRARIQAVDLERGLLHRLLGVTEVRVEALGGASTEGALPGVAPEQASALRAELLLRKPKPPRDDALVPVQTAAPVTGTGEASDRARENAQQAEAPVAGAGEEGPIVGAGEETVRGGGEGAPGEGVDEENLEGEEVLRLPGGEVVVAGLTESRLGAGLAVVGVGFEAVRQGAFSGWFGDPESWAPVMAALPWVALLVGFTILVLLFSLVLSFVLTVLGYWGFTLRRRGDVLAVERGLLTQHRETVPLRRIQAVRVVENPFRRLMGLAAVTVVVGGRVDARNRRSGTNVLLPVGSRDRAFALAAQVSGWAPPEAPLREPPLPEEGKARPRTIEDPGHPIPHLHPMPPGARARRRVRGLVFGLLVAWVAPALRHGPSALLPWSWTGSQGGLALGAGLLALLVGLALAEGAWRGLGWAFLGTHAAFREGILERVTTLVPLARLQSVEVVSNPFQRRRGLATLTVPVARPPLEEDPRALDLGQEEAEGLRDRILAGGGGHAAGPAGLSRTPRSGMFVC